MDMIELHEYLRTSRTKYKADLDHRAAIDNAFGAQPYGLYKAYTELMRRLSRLIIQGS